MSMEKIRLTSPDAHFSIMRNPDLFTMDRLCVNNAFYEILLQRQLVKIQ